jgi:hypothetical protein
MGENGKTSDHGSPDLFMPPGLINRLLVRVLWLEAKLLMLFDLPFGVGIVVLARKPQAIRTSRNLEGL